ncbi:MAG: hypothetical protein LBT81_05420 [Helicobacteraceae bacterium]|jgi:phosphoglycolate phosphatase-like HAD superfamily hydrolase|nr:hypothetical protein [Helicobacteraceae bacterium]
MDGNNALLIAVALLGLFLIVSVVMITVQTRRNSAAPEGKAAVAASEKTLPKGKSGRKSGVLIVAGRRFSFNYKERDDESVTRLLDLIKHSLQLIKESKYKEVIASRVAECEALLKKLGGVITFSEGGSMDDILDHFASYVKTLKV